MEQQQPEKENTNEESDIKGTHPRRFERENTKEIKIQKKYGDTIQKSY